MANELDAYRATEGWIGCPHCGRPVDATIVVAQAKALALRVLALRSQEAEDAAAFVAALNAVAKEAEDDLNDAAHPHVPRLVHLDP
jgi:uncharacterized protein (UPF0212 family)